MALDYHTGSEDISVEINHPLAIPPKSTLALQLCIEKIDIVFVVIRNFGIRDGNCLCTLKAKPLDLLDDPSVKLEAGPHTNRKAQQPAHIGSILPSN